MGKRLVRDRALETWTVPGAEHQVRPVQSQEEHRELLRAKLMEEAVEVILADTPADLTKELADLCAVITAIAAVHGIPWDAVLSMRQERAAQSGGFTKGLVWDTPR